VRQRLDALLAAGEAVEVTVDGWKDPVYLPASGVALLEDLEAERSPDALQPLETSTQEEVSFLAPLDIVSARGRAKVLFDFEYIWEVYKPAEKRRWGYSTMPVLYGDQLVARLEPKLDRTNRTLVVKGFWLESQAKDADAAFSAALGRGLARFAAFLDAERIDFTALDPSGLRGQVEAAVDKQRIMI
jgi:uncharacterized protein YcaQ